MSVKVPVCNHVVGGCVLNALELMYAFTVLFCAFLIVMTVLVLQVSDCYDITCAFLIVMLILMYAFIALLLLLLLLPLFCASSSLSFLLLLLLLLLLLFDCHVSSWHCVMLIVMYAFIVLGLFCFVC